MSKVLKVCGPFAVGVVLLVLFGLVERSVLTAPRQQAGPELLVSLPLVAQIAMAGGDRYLAANLATVRAVVASTESMKAGDFALQARIQSDASWLNPGNEDNYYVASAILPWYGQLEATQYILQRASEARPFDWQPPFYYAFNTYYFVKDYAEAARWLGEAAKHTYIEDTVLAFQQIAAQWAAKGPDLEAAIKLHRDMMKGTKHKEFAAFLEKRVKRLENLLLIEKACAAFRESFGRAPSTISELVKAGVMSEIPNDPFGLQYVFDKDGRPIAKLLANDTRGGAK